MMNITFTIDVPIFNSEVFCHVGSHETLIEEISKRLDSDEMKQVGECLTAFGHVSGFVHLFDDGKLLLFVDGTPRKCLAPPVMGIAVHELMHVVERICDTKGVPITPDTEETRAYLLKFLANEFFDAVKSSIRPAKQ